MVLRYFCSFAEVEDGCQVAWGAIIRSPGVHSTTGSPRLHLPSVVLGLEYISHDRGRLPAHKVHPVTGLQLQFPEGMGVCPLSDPLLPVVLGVGGTSARTACVSYRSGSCS